MKVVRLIFSMSMLVGLLWTVSSCKSEAPEQTGPVGTVAILDSATFFIDDTVVPPLEAAGAYQYIAEKHQLVYLNTYPTAPRPDKRQNIKFFDFNTGQVVNTIMLDKRGGHGFVITPTNFYYQSEDSIWVYPARVKLNSQTEGINYHEIGLLNSRGQVEMRPSLISGGIRSGMSRPMSPRYGGISRRGRQLIVSSQVLWGRKSSGSPFYTLDIKNARTGIIDFTPYKDLEVVKPFRSELNTVKRLSTVRSVMNRKDELVANFPLDHRLSVIDKGERVKKVMVKSRYLTTMPDLASLPEKGSSLEAGLEMAGFYAGILYDDVKDQYFRIVRLPTSSLNELPRYTVMVINNEFELIAESEFDGGQYLFEKGLFVGSGGLFVLSKPDAADRMTFVKLGVAGGAS